jgi:hypothetical protein
MLSEAVDHPPTNYAAKVSYFYNSASELMAFMFALLKGTGQIDRLRAV